jgi:hypothetical protein
MGKVNANAVAAAMTRSPKGLLCGPILAGLPVGQLIAIGKRAADEKTTISTAAYLAQKTQSSSILVIGAVITLPGLVAHLARKNPSAAADKMCCEINFSHSNSSN